MTKVLVTRGPHPDDPVIQSLAKTGIEAFSLRLETTETITDPIELVHLHQCLDALYQGHYSWFAFANSTCVDALDHLSRERQQSLSTLTSKVAIAASSASTAQALMTRGLAADIRPRGQSGFQALLSCWPPLPLHEDDRSVLIACADDADDTLIRGLRSRGWQVDAVVAYREVIPAELEPVILSSLAAGQVRVIFVTASSAVASVVELLGSAASGVKVVALDTAVAQAALAAGLEVHAIVGAGDPGGIAHALIAEQDVDSNP